jgi:hypothetical protein
MAAADPMQLGDDEEAEAPAAVIELSDEELQQFLQLDFGEDDFDERAAQLSGKELADALFASGMPFVLLNADKPDETTLMSSEEYKTSIISVVFCMVVDSLLASWRAGVMAKRGIVAAMIMVRGDGAHELRIKEGGRSGTLSPDLARACATYVKENNAFIICLDAKDAATIYTWCSVGARFEWLFLDALCKSFWKKQYKQRIGLSKENVIAAFGEAHNEGDNKRLIDSLFNELASL